MIRNPMIMKSGGSSGCAVGKVSVSGNPTTIHVDVGGNYDHIALYPWSVSIPPASWFASNNHLNKRLFVSYTNALVKHPDYSSRYIIGMYYIAHNETEVIDDNVATDNDVDCIAESVKRVGTVITLDPSKLSSAPDEGSFFRSGQYLWVAW